MILSQWAKRWNIPSAAVNELRAALGSISTDSTPVTGDSEAAVQNHIRLEASRKGARLWRNNSGAGYMEDGSFIRWGLCNDSKKMNSVIKSADLVGIKPVVITQGHVGSLAGIFLAREVKASGWAYSGTGREKAQLNFINLVNSLGGDAGFATGEGSI